MVVRSSKVCAQRRPAIPLSIGHIFFLDEEKAYLKTPRDIIWIIVLIVLMGAFVELQLLAII